MKDGYPERVCDYCHLQLNTFHAFVKKAKVTSAQFANLLKELIVYPISESSSKNDKNDAVLTISEMEFDVDTDNKPIRSTQNQLELDKAKVEIVGYDDGKPIYNKKIIRSFSILTTPTILKFQMSTPLNIWNQNT